MPKCSVKTINENVDIGQQLKIVTLVNDVLQVEILNLGACLCAVYVPDKKGIRKNIVLSYPDPLLFYADPYYLGATIGRIAGRVAGGCLPVGNKRFQLYRNENGVHHLHGGQTGFNKRLFEIISCKSNDESASVSFGYTSADGEENYPGKLALKVEYVLEKTSLTVFYHATTDKPTHVNITNHSYFNLADEGDALAQQLRINADQLLCVNEAFIPTGEWISVEKAGLSLKKLSAINTVKAHRENKMINDYFLFNAANGAKAELYDPRSNRRMLVYTSYPGMLFYSGDYLAQPFSTSSGICLEPQCPPDAPNQSYADQTLLLPGNEFSEFIKWEFGW